MVTEAYILLFPLWLFLSWYLHDQLSEIHNDPGAALKDTGSVSITHALTLEHIKNEAVQG